VTKWYFGKIEKIFATTKNKKNNGNEVRKVLKIDSKLNGRVLFKKNGFIKFKICFFFSYRFLINSFCFVLI